MIDILCNPYNVVALAGKRIRQVPVEQVHKVEIHDPENHGVPLVVAPSWDVAKVVAAYDGTYGLIWQRADRYLLWLVTAAYRMPGHE